MISLIAVFVTCLSLYHYETEPQLGIELRHVLPLAISYCSLEASCEVHFDLVNDIDCKYKEYIDDDMNWGER